jgi:integrase
LRFARLRLWRCRASDAKSAYADWYQSRLLVNSHRVRHSAITAYLDVSEGNVRAAQSLSRHQNLSTLMIYDNRHQLQGKASKYLGDLLEEVDRPNVTDRN